MFWVSNSLSIDVYHFIVLNNVPGGTVFIDFFTYYILYCHNSTIVHIKYGVHFVNSNISSTLLYLLTITLSSSFASTAYTDTLYYPHPVTISSISSYKDSTLTAYERFYVSGEKEYSVKYLYENDIIRSESLFDENDNQYAYGIYTFTDNGYVYDYFHIDNSLLTRSYYSSLGYCFEHYSLYSTGDVYSITTYEYDSLGFLTNESYFDGVGTLLATADWSYDEQTEVITYHYTFQGDSALSNTYTGELYNEYYSYYDSGSTLKDSISVLYNSEPVYTVNYSYDSNNYMISDQYFAPDGSSTATGTYSFNSLDFTTLYTYRTKGDSSIWKTTTNEKNLTTQSDYYWNNELSSITRYRYNEYLNIDSTLYYDNNDQLLAYSYTDYFDPFTSVKSWLYATPTDDTLNYCEYDEFGNTVAAVAIQKSDIKGTTTLPSVKRIGNTFHIDSVAFSEMIHYEIISVSGRVIKRGTVTPGVQSSIDVTNLAAGVYCMTIRDVTQVHSTAFIIH